MSDIYCDQQSTQIHCRHALAGTGELVSASSRFSPDHGRGGWLQVHMRTPGTSPSRPPPREPASGATPRQNTASAHAHCQRPRVHADAVHCSSIARSQQAGRDAALPSIQSRHGGGLAFFVPADDGSSTSTMPKASVQQFVNSDVMRNATEQHRLQQDATTVLAAQPRMHVEAHVEQLAATDADAAWPSEVHGVLHAGTSRHSSRRHASEGHQHSNYAMPLPPLGVLSGAPLPGQRLQPPRRRTMLDAMLQDPAAPAAQAHSHNVPPHSRAGALPALHQQPTQSSVGMRSAALDAAMADAANSTRHKALPPLRRATAPIDAATPESLPSEHSQATHSSTQRTPRSAALQFLKQSRLARHAQLTPGSSGAALQQGAAAPSLQQIVQAQAQVTSADGGSPAALPAQSGLDALQARSAARNLQRLRQLQPIAPCFVASRHVHSRARNGSVVELPDSPCLQACSPQRTDAAVHIGAAWDCAAAGNFEPSQARGAADHACSAHGAVPEPSAGTEPQHALQPVQELTQSDCEWQARLRAVRQHMAKHGEPETAAGISTAAGAAAVVTSPSAAACTTPRAGTRLRVTDASAFGGLSLDDVCKQGRERQLQREQAPPSAQRRNHTCNAFAASPGLLEWEAQIADNNDTASVPETGGSTQRGAPFDNLSLAEVMRPVQHVCNNDSAREFDSISEPAQRRAQQHDVSPWGGSLGQILTVRGTAATPRAQQAAPGQVVSPLSPSALRTRGAERRAANAEQLARRREIIEQYTRPQRRAQQPAHDAIGEADAGLHVQHPEPVPRYEELTEQAAVLNFLTLFKMDVELTSEAEAAGQNVMWDCAICLADFQQDQMMAQHPCGHVHHEACIRGCLKFGIVQCPLCRYDPLAGDDEFE